MVLAPYAVAGAAFASVILLYLYEQAFGSPLQGMANSVPVIGGYIAKGLAAAVDYGRTLFSRYVGSYITGLVSWIGDLADSIEGFVASVNAFLVDLPGNLGHLATETVTGAIKASVADVRDLAHDAQTLANHAEIDVQTLAGAVNHALVGIGDDVLGRVRHEVDVVRNVDLPNLHDVIGREIGAATGAVAGSLGDLRRWSEQEFDQVFGRLADIPLADLLALAGTVAGIGLLVNVIEQEAGLDTPGCRAKVRGLCAVDPGAWSGLLDLLAVVVLWEGLDAFVEIVQDFTREALGAALAMAHGA